jgi:hypothetical protein
VTRDYHVQGTWMGFAYFCEAAADEPWYQVSGLRRFLGTRLIGLEKRSSSFFSDD